MGAVSRKLSYREQLGERLPDVLVKIVLEYARNKALLTFAINSRKGSTPSGSHFDVKVDARVYLLEVETIDAVLPVFDCYPSSPPRVPYPAAAATPAQTEAEAKAASRKVWKTLTPTPHFHWEVNQLRHFSGVVTSVAAVPIGTCILTALDTLGTLKFARSSQWSEDMPMTLGITTHLPDPVDLKALFDKVGAELSKSSKYSSAKGSFLISDCMYHSWTAEDVLNF